jgi:hypothetical protein
MHFQNDLYSIYILINEKMVTRKIVLCLVSVNIVYNSVGNLLIFSAVFLNN